MTPLEIVLLITTLLFAGTTVFMTRKNNQHVAMYHELSAVNDKLLEQLERRHG